MAAETVSLDGRWLLRSTKPGAGERMGFASKGATGAGWIGAAVPGEVHAAMHAAGRIPEPLYGLNAKRLERLEGLDWWHVREFRLDGRQLDCSSAELVLEGVDLDCDVYLNGRRVARSLDAHVPIRAEVRRLLRVGRNLLVVRADDGTRRGSKLDPSGYRGWFQDCRLFLRKPHFVFRWDWAPRLVTCGVYRPVRLELHRGASILDLSARARLPRGRGPALVDVAVEVEGFAEGRTRLPAEMALELRLGRRLVASGRLRARLGRGRTVLRRTLRVQRPRLWWPAGYGESVLYDLSADLAVGNELRDTAERRIGLRSVAIEMRRLSPQEKSFTLVVNGVRTYCRGANWVPPDSLVGRETPETYRKLLDLAADSNFNMLRIWGGAGFERDLFFDLCDERGILIYMDFPFACMQYPGKDPAFRRLIEAEAAHHVRRLRNHPSLAVWCGNNEVNSMLDGFDVRRIPYRDTTRVIFDEILPRVIRRLDKTRPYVPSSPYYGEVAGSPLEGDRHAWEVSLGDPDKPSIRDWHTYDGDNAKFVGEWGLLSCSELATLRESLGARGLRPGSPEWKFHQNDFDRGIVERRVREWVHAHPGKLPPGDYVRATQMCQAEGLQYGIERWRRRKWGGVPDRPNYCSGSLYWMFNDSWPASTGWTTIDWRLRRKASYYAVRRAYAPVALSFAVHDGIVECWGVNDTLSDVRGRLKLGIMQMSGQAVGEKTLAARIPANSSVMLHSEPLLSWLDPAKEFYWARLVGASRVVAEACRLMDWFRFLLLEPPKLRAKLRPAPGGAVMELTAGNFCRMVELVLPRGVEADDNFFDLYPGKKVAVALTGDVRAARRVKVTAMNRIVHSG